MKEQILETLNDIKSLKIIEAHSNFQISDEELVEAIENNMVDASIVEMYLDVLGRMHSNSLTEEDQTVLFEAFAEDVIDQETYAQLISEGVVSEEMTKNMLMESVGLMPMSELQMNAAALKSGAANVINKTKSAAGQIAQKTQQGAQQVAQKTQQVAQKAQQGAGQLAQKSKVVAGQTLQAAGKLANNVIGHGARAVAAGARAIGAHGVAKNVYKFASNRFLAAGNKARAVQARANAIQSVRDGQRKDAVQASAVNNVAAKAGEAAKPNAAQAAGSVKEKLSQLQKNENGKTKLVNPNFREGEEFFQSRFASMNLEGIL